MKIWGQHHDEYDEFIDGNIFSAIIIASKFYIITVIGYSKVKGEEGKLVLAEHKRGKGINKEKRD